MADQQTPLDPIFGSLAGPIETALATLSRRGMLTTEWWTQAVAGVMAMAEAKAGIPGPAAVQVTAILAPILVSTGYNLFRANQKKALAQAVSWLHQHLTELPTIPSTKN